MTQTIDPRVRDILGSGLASVLESTFSKMEIAEDEIARARGGKTAPDRSDPLWCSFKLMAPYIEMTDVAYRVHCRELLERVAAGEDTRPGTDGEIMMVLSETSMQAPLTHAATTLQLRLFARRLPNEAKRADLVDELENLEAVSSHRRGADELEAESRRKLAQPERRIA